MFLNRGVSNRHLCFRPTVVHVVRVSAARQR